MTRITTLIIKAPHLFHGKTGVLSEICVKEVGVRLLFVLIFSISSMAQDFHYTQFNMAPFSVNPSLIASDKYLKAIVHYRNQKIGQGLDYSTIGFSFFTPIYGKKYEPKLSLGASFMDDRFVGDYVFVNQRLSLALAYNLKLSRTSNLLFGLQFDYFMQTFSFGSGSTGSQYVEGRGYDVSVSNGENLKGQQQQYYAFRPGVFYQKKDKDSSILYQVGLSLNNLGGAYTGYLGNSVKLNQGLVFNGKFKAYGNADFSINPEALYSYYNGNSVVTAGAVASKKFEMDSLHSIFIDAGLWYTTLHSAAVSLQVHLQRITIAASYQTDFAYGSVQSPGNTFEIVIAYKKPIKFASSKTEKEKREENKKKLAELNRKKRVKRALRVKDSEYASEPLKKIDKLKPPIIISNSEFRRDSLSTVPNPDVKPDLSKPEDFDFKLNGKVYSGKLNDPVYFSSGSAKLNESFHLYLDDMTYYLKVNPKARILIFGHTDDIGSLETNQKISHNRAKAVKDYLIKQGIDENRLIEKGIGFEKPQHPNDSEENRAKNRRVELVIFK